MLFCKVIYVAELKFQVSLLRNQYGFLTEKLKRNLFKDNDTGDFYDFKSILKTDKNLYR